MKPTYYKPGSKDVIAFCFNHNLGFCEGNIIKYITRAGKKNSKLEDLLKAREYLDRLIAESTDINDQPSPKPNTPDIILTNGWPTVPNSNIRYNSLVDLDSTSQYPIN